jgi:SAM-dependent methyltransferase
MTSSNPTPTSLPPSYFEAKYQADIDPWRFRTSDYEREKYQATIHALSKPRFERGLECGCAIGVLSALLADRCDELISVDVSATAIAEAKRQYLPNVRFEIAHLPSELPSGKFDLIVLSEILYYFSSADLNHLAEACLTAADAEAELILCHWLGETDYPLTGHEASELFARACVTRQPRREILHEGIYRLERLSFERKAADGAR